MTTNQEERLLGRFKSEFETRSLANIKFFVHGGRISAKELVNQINQFEASVAAGDAATVDSIDEQQPKIRFDAPFM